MLRQSHDDNKDMVQNPWIDSYQHVLDIVGERPGPVWTMVSMLRAKDDCNALQETHSVQCTHQAVYHHSCYANATNNDQIQRSRDRHAHALATGRHTTKKCGQKGGGTPINTWLFNTIFEIWYKSTE